MNAPARGIPLRPDRTALAAEQRKSLHRALASLVLKSSSTSRISPEKFCAASWPHDDFALRVVKAVSAPASTTTATALQLSAVGMFRSLAPSSAALQLFEAGFSIDLRGLHDVRIPSITAALPTVTFVGEGEPTAAIDLSFSGTAVGPVKKLAILAAISQELENASSPELATAVVARVLGDATQKALDVAAFSSFAGDPITPPGLLHNVTPLTAASAGIDAMAADLAALSAAVASSNIAVDDLVYVAAPRQATTIKVKASPLFTNTVLSSLAMPDASVAAFAPQAVLSGLGDLPSIETSTQATINFAQPAGEIVDAGGTVATPVYDVFQQNLIAIRLRSYVAWSCVPGGCALVSATNW